jgi:pimeloyl-ACP methyl ester carboxylesterase
VKHPDGVRFGYVDTHLGQLHYAEAGSGPPLLCLHQTPRSWDEYRELIPLLAPHVRVIALDTPGMGASAAHRGTATIESYTDGAVAALAGLGIHRAHVLGHHTGGVIALDLAARYVDRVDHLVLSSTPWVDAASRERRASRAPIDHADRHDDGLHLTELWARRKSFYPPGRPDVLERYVHDLIAARDPEEGHLAVGRYRMEDTIGRVTAPTLCLGASDDPHAFPDHGPLADRIAGARRVVIHGGTVGLLEDKAPEVAAAVIDFLPLDAHPTR